MTPDLKSVDGDICKMGRTEEGLSYFSDLTDGDRIFDHLPSSELRALREASAATGLSVEEIRVRLARGETVHY